MQYALVEDVCKFLVIPLPKRSVMSEEEKLKMQAAWSKRMSETNKVTGVTPC